MAVVMLSISHCSTVVDCNISTTKIFAGIKTAWNARHVKRYMKCWTSLLTQVCRSIRTYICTIIIHMYYIHMYYNYTYVLYTYVLYTYGLHTSLLCTALTWSVCTPTNVIAYSVKLQVLCSALMLATRWYIYTYLGSSHSSLTIFLHGMHTPTLGTSVIDIPPISVLY